MIIYFFLRFAGFYNPPDFRSIVPVERARSSPELILYDFATIFFQHIYDEMIAASKGLSLDV